MSEEMLVRHCSPTLAGMKTGTVFTCFFQTKKAMCDSLCRYNKRLARKGLHVMPLRYRNQRALIYVYRPQQLSRDLTRDTVGEFLQERGYATQSPQRCLMYLRQRLQEGEEFPHEIGLFLGYPPEDVRGFIEDPSACKCVGCWKVYGDEEKARETFRKYKKCTDIFCAQLALGKPIERLAVAV